MSTTEEISRSLYPNSKKPSSKVSMLISLASGDGKVSLVAAFSPEVIKMGLQAGKFIGGIAKICGGGGGVRPNFAQAGGRKPEKLLDALEKARSELVEAVNRKTAT
ncbi:uncharacterized protein A4U43_C06F2100 [Asparagus officinalis]|uniref:Alanine--tRNA ligase n=1 Tax=Asparagus officinalis TaxID=4686 RepID=A0A5P1EL19_ASPOF|nr:uncharacterized protein A4U43_C06F2100 [Asparagus officinalis]